MPSLWLLIQGSTGLPDFTAIPAPVQNITNYWPLVTAVISLVIAAVSAVFTAWQKIRERRLENAASSEQTRLTLEIEELKHQFDSRAQLHEQLTSQITSSLTEARELRKELQSARLLYTEKETIISGLRIELGAAKSQLLNLEADIARLQIRLNNTVVTPLPRLDPPAVDEDTPE